jgi:mxaL protein
VNVAAAALARCARAPWRWLLAAACTALAATFLDPSLPMKRPQYRLLFVLDVSQSMNATDQVLGGQPASRAAFARATLRGALRELPCGSQAGLGLFTEYRSYLLLEPVEICANYSELAATLDRLDYRMGWAGGSEIAKGIFFGLRIAKALDPPAALVFITDGHEAPPINPKLRPQYEGDPGAVKGVLLGVGGSALVPIPKFGMDGKPLGYWGADEVLQTDVYSRGRGGSVPDEAMVDADQRPTERAAPGGSEHLTSLKEPYLQQLASELGLGYFRLESASGLVAALKDAGLTTDVTGRVDLRWLLAIAALAVVASMFVPQPRGGSKRHDSARGSLSRRT